MSLTTQSDEYLRYMIRAIELARIGADTPGAAPIGCVIVRDGLILGEGYNEVDSRHDPSAHADIVTIQRVGRAPGSTDFRGATLYSTLQPCGMCSMASIWARIGRIVYGAGRADVHRMYFEDRHLNTVDFIADAFRNDIALVGGVVAAQCAALYHGPHEILPTKDQGNI